MTILLNEFSGGHIYLSVLRYYHTLTHYLEHNFNVIPWCFPLCQSINAQYLTFGVKTKFVQKFKKIAK